MSSKKHKNEKHVTDKFGPYFRRGTERLRRGEHDKALPLLEKAHQLDPEHLDTAINLSGAYILTKKFRQAADLLRPFTEKHPHHVMLWTNFGAALLGNPVLATDEHQQRAIAAFEKAYELNPAAPNVAYNIGLIYRDRRAYDQAIGWFEKALQANPADQDARRLIARLQEKSASSEEENPNNLSA